MQHQNKYKNIKQVEKELRKKLKKHEYVHIFFNYGAIEITNFEISGNRIFLYYYDYQIAYIEYESITDISPLD